MKVVVCPDSFKGTVTAARAAAAIGRGWAAVRPEDELALVPMADGGEGTLDAFACAYADAERRSVEVSGPDGRPRQASWLQLPDATAVVELAEASGLPIRGAADAMSAHTVGLGQLLHSVVDARVERVYVGLGGSASTDGGVGALAALGARILDAEGRDLEPGGRSLRHIDRIDTAMLLRPPPFVVCLTDVTAPLYGPTGAAHVFGPQKGAGVAEIAELDAGLRHLAEILPGDPSAPGSGAAGGTAYGMAAAWGAGITSGAATVADLLGLPARIAAADVVLTGEGQLDRSSLGGKVVGHVAELASDTELHVITGRDCLASPAGPASVVDLGELAGSFDAALADPERWIEAAAVQLARDLDGAPRRRIMP